jgi:hypothetical protein
VDGNDDNNKTMSIWWAVTTNRVIGGSCADPSFVSRGSEVNHGHVFVAGNSKVARMCAEDCARTLAEEACGKDLDFYGSFENWGSDYGVDDILVIEEGPILQRGQQPQEGNEEALVLRIQTALPPDYKQAKLEYFEDHDVVKDSNLEDSDGEYEYYS